MDRANWKELRWKEVYRLDASASASEIKQKILRLVVICQTFYRGSSVQSVLFVSIDYSVHKFKNGTSTTNLSIHLSGIHKINGKEVSSTEASNKLTAYFGWDATNKKTTEIDPNRLLSRRLVLLCCKNLISYYSLSSESIGYRLSRKSFSH